MCVCVCFCFQTANYHQIVHMYIHVPITVINFFGNYVIMYLIYNDLTEFSFTSAGTVTTGEWTFILLILWFLSLRRCHFETKQQKMYPDYDMNKSTLK